MSPLSKGETIFITPFSFQKSSAPIMGFIGLAIALPPPSVHEVNRIKWKIVSQNDFFRFGWKRTCSSPDFPLTSKLLTVNPSESNKEAIETEKNLNAKGLFIYDVIT